MNKKMPELTPLQRRIVFGGATEPPFDNEYWDNERDGLYVDAVSGTPLFSSRDKFDSGSGWPSFTKPIDKGALKEVEDKSHGRIRIEVRSKNADTHLGHVFDDGPRTKGGLRYCINSAAIHFIPEADLEKEGYLPIWKDGKK